MFRKKKTPGVLKEKEISAFDMCIGHRLPTAMEEVKIEAPILYDWLIKNGMVRGENFEDMLFELFSAITIRRCSHSEKYYND